MAPLSAGSSDPVALYDLAVLLTSALDSCHIDPTSELFITLLHCQNSVWASFRSPLLIDLTDPDA